LTAGWSLERLKSTARSLICLGYFSITFATLGSQSYGI